MPSARVRYCGDCKEWITGSHDCPMRCRACHRLLTKLELAIVEKVREKLGSSAPQLCRICTKIF